MLTESEEQRYQQLKSQDNVGVAAKELYDLEQKRLDKSFWLLAVQVDGSITILDSFATPELAIQFLLDSEQIEKREELVPIARSRFRHADDAGQVDAYSAMVSVTPTSVRKHIRLERRTKVHTENVY